MTHHDSDYSNRTLYSIERDAVRYTWAGYCLFVIASSFIGDTTILVASIKYRAFKLHRAIIVIIQHLAFCDLMVSALDVFPRLISVMTNEWVLGNFLCYLTAYVRYYFNAVNVLLLCALTSGKLLHVKYPFQANTATAKKAHIFCFVSCWLIPMSLPALCLIVDPLDIHFSYKDYQCIYAATSDIWYWSKVILTVSFIFIPISVAITSTILLLIIAKRIARRGRDSLKWQGIIAIVLTATVYCISLLPYVVFRIVESVIVKDNPDRSQRIFLVNFYRAALSFVSLNTICNFFIYILIVESFRSFVLNRIELSRGSLTTGIRTIAGAGWHGKKLDIYLITHDDDLVHAAS